MLRLLEQPYPLAESRLGRWRTALLFGLFVSLFLYIFRPVGFNQIEQQLGWHALAYGLICSGIMVLLNIVLPELFKKYFTERGWTTGRQIGMTMLNISCIGMGNALYTHFAFDLTLSPAWLLYFAGITLGIGLLPVSAGFVLNQLLLERRYREASDQLNAHWPAASESAISQTSPELLELRGENQQEILVLAPEALLYLAAAGNYTEIWHLEAGLPKKVLLRGSLGYFAKQLQSDERFWRCHKSYVVNKQQLLRSSGNAQGYSLHLAHGAGPVPVSRAFNNQLSTLLQV